jgi:hypothetical protein
MSYSLNAFMPWEGYRVAINGAKGRLEYDHVESIKITRNDKTIPTGSQIRLYPHFKPAQNIPVVTGKGSHGGGDSLLLKDLFSPNPPKDKYMKAAGIGDGAMSILIGIAANKSMATGKSIKIDSLVKNIPPVKQPVMKEW